MSEWNIDFLIAVLLLNELFWGSRGKANSDAWLAGFALALLNTPRVLMWEIQQREEGGIFFCVAQTWRGQMALTSGTGLFSHKAQNSPLASDTRAAARERTNCEAEASYAIVPGRGCCSPSAQLCLSSPHTHTGTRAGFEPPWCLFAADGQCLAQLWRDELLGHVSPVAMESPQNREGPPGEKSIPGKGTFLGEKQTGPLWLFFSKPLVRHFGK